MNAATHNDAPSGHTDRAFYLFRWSRALDWNTDHTAAQLGVSPRTVNLWETGAQPMPESRWLLFALLVQQAAENRLREDLQKVEPGGPGLAVVIGPNGKAADVVSRDNYAGHVVDRYTGMGMVASIAVDRVTRKERLHTQAFNLAGNEVFVQAAEQWAAYRDIIVNAHERWAFLLHRQMVQQALRAEMKNPGIRALKEAVEKASVERNAIGDDQPIEVHHEAERKLQAAIQALQDAIAKNADN